jgi:3'-phosphoadenosine 5'-phosphosulfate sulfotransferase (PAPS reductase)/FAD synthetase
MNKLSIGDLRQRQSLPLELKIRKSIRTIEDFYDKCDGDIYISKGGVDSCVVEWLCSKTIYADKIKGVCVATVEPVENIRFNRNMGNLLLKSSLSKKDIITKYGYPIISKEVAMKLSRYLRTKHEWVKERRLKGYMGKNGKWIYDSRIPLKYQSLIYAPIEFSEKCCDFTKKKPLKDYEKKTGKKPLTGERADETHDRQREYLKHGCIMFDKKRIKCTPIGFWTDQDKIRLLKVYNIDYPKSYGEIKVEYDGSLYFSGESRTGCEICGFGIYYDKDRFSRMKENKKGLYDTMMKGGRWARKDIYRWVKFRPNSIPIWSNLYWVPSDEGYGYKFVINYLNGALKEKIEI